MNKRIRAFSSLFLSIALLLTITSPGLALDQSGSFNTSVYSEAGLTQYAHSMAASYLRINNLVDSQVSYFITQGIPIENDSDPYNRLYFIFAGNVSIGYLIATVVADEYSSSFVHTNIPAIDSANQSHSPLQVVAFNNSFYIWSQNQFIKIIGTSNQIPNSSLYNSAFGTTIVELSELAIHYTAARGSSAQIMLPNFPIVDNDSVTINGNLVGLCWVACVSAIGEYETGTTAPVITLFNWAKSNISYSGSYPNGTIIHARNTLNGYYGLNYSYSLSPMNAGSIWSEMVNRTPVMALISRYNSQGERFGHMVVVCGMIFSENEYYYILMDPNVPNYVTVYVGGASSTQFTYVSNSGTYTNCEANAYR